MRDDTLKGTAFNKTHAFGLRNDTRGNIGVMPNGSQLITHSISEPQFPNPVIVLLEYAKLLIMLRILIKIMCINDMAFSMSWTDYCFLGSSAY